MNRKKYAISVICTYAGKHNVKLGEKWAVLFPHSSPFHIILLFLRLFFNLAGLSVLNWLLVSLCYKSPIHPSSNVLVNMILCVCVRLCMCVHTQSQSCWTLCLPDSSVHGFLRQEYRSGLSFPPPEDLFNPGIEPYLLHWQTDSLPPQPPGKILCGSNWN